MTKREFIESLYWPLIAVAIAVALITLGFNSVVIVGFWPQALWGFIQGIAYVLVVRLFMRHASKKLDRVVTHPERVSL